MGGEANQGAQLYRDPYRASTSASSCLTRSASPTGQTSVTSRVATTTLSRTPTSATTCSGSSESTTLPAASSSTTGPATALPAASVRRVCASAGQEPTSSQSTSRATTTTRPGSAEAGSRTA